MYEGTLLQKIWKIVNPVLVYFFVALFVQVAANFFIGTEYFFGLSSYPGEAGRSAMYDFVENFSVMVAENTVYISIFTLLITIIIIYRMYNQEKYIRLEYYNIEHRINFAAVILLALVMSTGFSRLISLFFSQTENSYQQIEDNLLSGNIYMVILAVGVLAPIAEELIFRGLIYNRLKQYTSQQLATVISAAMFGAYHFNLPQGLFACFLGIALVFVYEKYKTIWAPVSFHMSANLFSVFLSKTGISDFLSKNIVVYVFLMLIELFFSFILFYYINKSIIIQKHKESPDNKMTEKNEENQNIFDKKI